MGKICIATDTNAGISIEEGKALDVLILPMVFLINGETYKEGIDLTREDFFSYLQKDVNVSTSQPTPGEMIQFFEDALKEYDEIVYIPLSSGLSNTCENAKIYAQEFKDKVFVVDNHRISVTQKFAVYDAIKLRGKGLSAKEITEYLEKETYNSSIYITLDTMKYLVKGGRCTPAAATAAKLLHLKPTLVNRGEKFDKFNIMNRTIVKAKQVMIDAMKKDMEERFKEYYENGEMALAVAHTENFKQAESFKNEIEKEFPKAKVYFVDPLSLVVSCHIGPGSLAIASSRIIKD